jgi:hypothetical protein
VAKSIKIHDRETIVSYKPKYSDKTEEKHTLGRSKGKLKETYKRTADGLK